MSVQGAIFIPRRGQVRVLVLVGQSLLSNRVSTGHGAGLTDGADRMLLETVALIWKSREEAGESWLV